MRDTQAPTAPLVAPGGAEASYQFRGSDRCKGRPSTQPDIVINGRFASQPLSGVQRYATELVVALDKLLARGEGGERLHRIELHVPKGGIPSWQLRAIIPREVGRLSGHAWEQLELARSARGAVLLSLCNTGPILHDRQVVVIHDAAIVIHPDNFTFLFRNWYRILYHIFAKRAQRLVTVSHASADDLRRWLPITSARLSIVPNAADHFERVSAAVDVIERHGLKPGQFVVAVSSASLAKNTKIIARSLALVPPPRPQLVWVGEQNPRIFRDPDATVATASVVLARVSDPELRALYSSALCLVFPSIYEGFGLPPLEAMRCKCAVIASDIPALREVCADAAVYFDPHDAAALAEKITQLRDQPRHREVLMAKGKIRADVYRWEYSARQLLELLREAAAS